MLYLDQDGGGSRAYPKNTRCEAGIHPGPQFTSPSRGTLHTHSLLAPTRMFLKGWRKPAKRSRHEEDLCTDSNKIAGSKMVYTLHLQFSIYTVIFRLMMLFLLEFTCTKSGHKIMKCIFTCFSHMITYYSQNDDHIPHPHVLVLFCPISVLWVSHWLIFKNYIHQHPTLTPSCSIWCPSHWSITPSHFAEHVALSYTVRKACYFDPLEESSPSISYPLNKRCTIFYEIKKKMKHLFINRIFL